MSPCHRWCSFPWDWLDNLPKSTQKSQDKARGIWLLGPDSVCNCYSVAVKLEDVPDKPILVLLSVSSVKSWVWDNPFLVYSLLPRRHYWPGSLLLSSWHLLRLTTTLYSTKLIICSLFLSFSLSLSLSLSLSHTHTHTHTHTSRAKEPRCLHSPMNEQLLL